MLNKNLKTCFIGISLSAVLIVLSGCGDKNEIDYQNGYPNKLADNWIAFEFQGGNINGTSYEPYDLVTSLDPNQPGKLILDKLYASNIRVKAEYTKDTVLNIFMGEQLELINQNTYDVEFVSITGYLTTNTVWRGVCWQLANIYFPDLSFQSSDIEEVLYLHAGYYDKYKSMVDTVLIVAYRKTGFEEVNF